MRERVSEILREHRLLEYSWGTEEDCQCGHLGDDHAAHVSQVLVTELGLTQWEKIE